MNKSLLLVFLGGGAGAAARYASMRAVSRWNGTMPVGLGTGTLQLLVVNVGGSFVIGLLACLAVATRTQSQSWYLLAVTGFLGGYTTFSSYALDALRTVQGTSAVTALSWYFGQAVLGLAACALGWAVGTILPIGQA